MASTPGLEFEIERDETFARDENEELDTGTILLRTFAKVQNDAESSRIVAVESGKEVKRLRHEMNTLLENQDQMCSHNQHMSHELHALREENKELRRELRILRGNQDDFREEMNALRGQSQQILDLLHARISGNQGIMMNTGLEHESVNSSPSCASKPINDVEAEPKRSPKLQMHAASGTIPEFSNIAKSAWASTPRQVPFGLDRSGLAVHSIGVTSPRHFSGDGKEPFEDYLQHFKAMVLLHDWNRGIAALQLEVCLEGHAQKLALELQEEDRRDYDKLVSHLKKRLGKSTREQDYVREFYAREKNLQESPADFAITLQKLARKAFPGREQTEVESLIKRQFATGYGDANVALALSIENKETSLWDLVDRATDVLDVLKTSKSSVIRKPMIAPIATGKTCSEVCTSSGKPELKKMIADLENEMRQLKNMFSKEMEELKFSAPRRQDSYGHRRRFEGNCNHCGMYGHSAKFCRVRVCGRCRKNGHWEDECREIPPNDDMNDRNGQRNPSVELATAPKDFLGRR